MRIPTILATALASGVGALLIAVPGAGPAAVSAEPAARAGKPEATIRWTEHGIPHITAKDFRGLGYGSGYEYDHDAEEAFSGQDYFPEEMRRQAFYRPTERGAEAAIAERMARWERLRRKRRRG